jgi:hypothetical protein
MPQEESTLGHLPEDSTHRRRQHGKTGSRGAENGGGTHEGKKKGAWSVEQNVKRWAQKPYLEVRRTNRFGELTKESGDENFEFLRKYTSM